MTGEEFARIEDGLTRITSGPWISGKARQGPDERWWYSVAAPHITRPDGMLAVIAKCGFVGDEDWDKQSQIDADWIAASPDVVRALLGEVTRLRDYIAYKSDNEDWITRPPSHISESGK